MGVGWWWCGVGGGGGVVSVGPSQLSCSENRDLNHCILPLQDLAKVCSDCCRITEIAKIAYIVVFRILSFGQVEKKA